MRSTIFVVPTKPQPEHRERDERTCGIEQRVIGRSSAAGYESLVDLIQGGITRGNEERGDPPGRTPAWPVAPHCAVKQKAIHKIFREVRALANDVMHEVVLGLGEAWYQPAQNRFEKPGRVIGGKSVRGHGENHA